MYVEEPVGDRVGAVFSGFTVRTSFCILDTCKINYSTLMHRYVSRIQYPQVFIRHNKRPYTSCAFYLHLSTSNVSSTRLLPSSSISPSLTSKKNDFHRSPFNPSQLPRPCSASQSLGYRLCAPVNRCRRFDKHTTVLEILST
jgi:hypothetical protein